MKHDKNDLLIKSNYKTYLITHCLKIHLLVMGFIEKPAHTILLYNIGIFSVLGRTTVLETNVSRFSVNLFIVLIC